VIGPTRLSGALWSRAAAFRRERPRIVGTLPAGRGHSVVRFFVNGMGEGQVPLSLSFVRRHGVWSIAFDPELDTALVRYTLDEYRARVTPLSRTVSDAALRAGYAAQYLQSAALPGRRRTPR
jgi:hypothetical protein